LVISIRHLLQIGLTKTGRVERAAAVARVVEAALVFRK
jgi:hypothetical protein